MLRKIPAEMLDRRNEEHNDCQIGEMQRKHAPVRGVEFVNHFASLTRQYFLRNRKPHVAEDVGKVYRLPFVKFFRFCSCDQSSV